MLAIYRELKPSLAFRAVEVSAILKLNEAMALVYGAMDTLVVSHYCTLVCSPPTLMKAK